MGNKTISPPNDFLLDDGSQILEAIRSGCVDAFVVEELDGHAIYTLQSADLPYSTLVERMQQGAAMLDANGEMIYCNPGLAALVGMARERMIGVRLEELIHPDDRSAFQQLRAGLPLHTAVAEMRLQKMDASVVPARVSVTTLSRDRSVTGVLITDLTTEKSNSELLSRIQHLQDEERRNIARELHDSVGQLLAAITMNLAAARKEAMKDSVGAMIEDCNVMVAQVSKEIRTISHLLHPPLLDVAGLCSAIRWYVDGFSQRSHIKVDLDLPADVGRLSSDAEIAIFRAVQECLTNVYRHSGSQSCSVKLERRQDVLWLEISDEGQGMPKPTAATAQQGVGLRGMHERLRQLGGSLEIKSVGNGTTIIAMLPVQRESEGAA